VQVHGGVAIRIPVFEIPKSSTVRQLDGFETRVAVYLRIDIRGQLRHGVRLRFDLLGWNSARDYLTQLYRQQNPAAQIDVRINPVSTRLRLPDCAAPLTVEAPRGSGSRITTRVACDGPQHWALFVTAKVGILHQVMITRRPVGRGEVLGNDDIESRLLDISDETRGYYLAPEDVIGRSASRHLPNASILNAGMLTNSTLIERGDSVIIEVRTGAMLLRAQGTALEDGEDGAQIRVRNDRSGQEIKALVVARGLVRPLTR
jgi:flagella basal body P-ring formation protein FlgA